MQKQSNKNKLVVFGFLAAIIASMTFIAVNGGIKAALAQGTNETSSSSSMNMTGTETHGHAEGKTESSHVIYL